MNIAPVHIDALKALGYTEAEARFLYLVATHSGYFVARQFLAFANAHWGSAPLVSGTSFTPRSMPAPNVSQRAASSTTYSPAGSTTRSTARTSATAGNTKSNTSSGALESLITGLPFSDYSPIRNSKPFKI
jgi:hypothetical protein